MANSIDKSIVSPIVIGREQEVEALARLVALASEAKGQIALISGEAGIGKSRLVQEVKSRAAAGTLILEGLCLQTESALPYAPLLDLFRQYISTHPKEKISYAFRSVGPQLVKLFPVLARYLPNVESAPGVDPKQEKLRTLQALTQVCMELAQAQPIIMVIEDLHWSDSTSLEFLAQFTRRIATSPVLLVITYRSDETTPELTHFLAELDRQRVGTEFALKPMSPNEVEMLLRTILDLNTPISQEFMEAILPLTEGNPFFIEEIVKTLMADGDIFYADGAWDRKDVSQLHLPRTIQDAVQRRTQKLEKQTLRALTMASVIGRRFNFHLLRELLEINELVLMGMLKELVNAQLIVEESADQFAFRHALTRKAVYATLLQREQQAMHRLVGDMLEKLNAASMDAHLADLSYQYFMGEVWQKALEYSKLAGDQARMLYSQREVIVSYSRVLVAARHLNLLPSPEVLSARGHAYEILGDFKSALDDFEQALKIAKQLQDGQAEWQTLIDLGFLWAGREYKQAGAYFARAEEVAQRLNKPDLHARSLNSLGNWLVNTGKTATGLQLHGWALNIFKQAQDEQGMAETRDLLGMATMQNGDMPASFDEYQHAIELFRKLDDKHGLIAALTGSSNTFVWNATNRFPDAPLAESFTQAAEALELTRQTGWAAGQAFIEWTIARLSANRGLFAEAIEHASESLRIATEINHRQWIVGAQFTLGHIHLLMLQADTAIQWFELAFAFANKLGSIWWIGNISADLAMAYLLKNDLPRAKSVLETSRELETDEHSLVSQRLLWANANILLAEGHPAKALKIVDDLLALKPVSQEIHLSPYLLKLKGQILLAQKQAKKAVLILEQAKVSALQWETLPLLWQIHASLGWMYKDQKDVEKSNAEFAQARQMIETLSANIREESLQAAFKNRAADLLPREKTLTKRQSEAEKFGGLTTREREVMRFLSQGKSNREIAESLVLSERTVENHVANILNKLGLDSRAQAAVWAVEKGLTE